MSKSTSSSFVVALALSFSPWLVGLYLFLSPTSENRSPLSRQVFHRDSASIPDVIARRNYGNLKSDGDGWLGPLADAAMHSRREPIWTALIEDLIKHGADVNEISSFTPLQAAAWGGNTEIIKLLIRHGAQVNFPNCWGETPLMKASQGGSKEAVVELLNAGANAKTRDKTGQTALDRVNTRIRNPVGQTAIDRADAIAIRDLLMNRDRTDE